jgi:hypothetical protein
MQRRPRGMATPYFARRGTRTAPNLKCLRLQSLGNMRVICFDRPHSCKSCMHITLKAATVTAALLASPWAQAAAADCRFAFEGETYIDGPCDFKPAAGGSFRIEASGYLVQVDVTGNTAEGSWNGDVRASHLQHPLHMDGVLKRQGACWESPGVQICAWGGKRPASAPAVQAAARQEARPYPDFHQDNVGSWNLVQVKRAGQVQHCYGFVLAEGDGSPLRLQVDRAGAWTLIAPTGGKPKGFQGIVDAEFHKSSAQLKARVDATGQRMLIAMSANDLQQLEAGANLQLSYGKVPVYRFEQTRQALTKLRQCAGRPG